MKRDYLFVSLKSPYSQLNTSGVEVMLRKVSKAAGLETVNPHMLRHSFASHMVEHKLVVDDMQQSHIYLLPNGGTIYFLQNISLDKAIECAVENEYDINRIILTRKYQSNVKSGLWEVAFITGFEPTINEHHRKTYV